MLICPPLRVPLCPSPPPAYRRLRALDARRFTRFAASMLDEQIPEDATNEMLELLADRM